MCSATTTMSSMHLQPRDIALLIQCFPRSVDLPLDALDSITNKQPSMNSQNHRENEALGKEDPIQKHEHHQDPSTPPLHDRTAIASRPPPSSNPYHSNTSFLLISMHHLSLSCSPSSPSRTNTRSPSFFIRHHIISPLPLQSPSSWQISLQDPLHVLIDRLLPAMKALQSDDLSRV